MAISVSGIGPKLALAILSLFNPSELAVIFNNDDYNNLSKVNGLGLKKAQKLIIELKDKISIYEEPDNDKYELFVIKNDIKLALQSLGYEKVKIETYLDDEYIMQVKDTATLMKEILIKISKMNL